MNMEKMNGSLLRENDMSNQDEIANRLHAVEQEIYQGWAIYGRYMDMGQTVSPEAIEVREVIRKLTEEKNKLLMLQEPDAAKLYIEKHKELLNGKVG
jgi:hypothetical protein